MRRIVAVAALCLAAAACATPQTDYLRRHPGAVAPKASVAHPVFFAQRTSECGPAALAMILARSGVPVEPGDLLEAVYNPGRGGSLAPAVLGAARRYGRVAYPIGDLETLFRQIGDGRPVLVLQNLGLGWFPQWHYAVVVGYDLGRGIVTLHSGKTRFLETPLETFERTWERGGHWGLVALRPGDIPEKADERPYVRAVAGLERAGHGRGAAAAYAAAVERWPGSLVARMGLGNALYRQGDRDGAAQAFRAAAERHPRAADPLNNLAHVEAELGRFEAAERAARRAVALGGANVDTYRETLGTVLAARRTHHANSP